jgi:hypothetical protein
MWKTLHHFHAFCPCSTNGVRSILAACCPFGCDLSDSFESCLGPLDVAPHVEQGCNLIRISKQLNELRLPGNRSLAEHD